MPVEAWRLADRGARTTIGAFYLLCAGQVAYNVTRKPFVHVRGNLSTGLALLLLLGLLVVLVLGIAGLVGLIVGARWGWVVTLVLISCNLIGYPFFTHASVEELAWSLVAFALLLTPAARRYVRQRPRAPDQSEADHGVAAV